MVTKIKKTDEKIKIRRLNNLILKKGIFPRLLNCLEDTINKSAIVDFQNYLKKFPDITKWTVYSDYCLDDKNKNSDVYSFALFPHIKDFRMLLDEISSNIKKDLKEKKVIAEETLDYLKNENFFVFNFIFPKKYFNAKDFYKEKEINSLKKHIEIIKDNWKDDESKRRILMLLRKWVKELEVKSFSIKLYFQILICSFLAAYICVLLQREKGNVEIYSWLSDQDDMTTFAEGVITAIYILRKEEIKTIMKLKIKPIIEGFYTPKSDKELFYEPLIKIPDHFCGTLATVIKNNENNLQNFESKYIQIVEGVLKENKNIINIEFLRDTDRKKLAVQRLVFRNKNLV